MNLVPSNQSAPKQMGLMTPNSAFFDAIKFQSRIL